MSSPNRHANTTIPEILGAAAAYKATGERKWLDICLAYWKQTVTDRGRFCTGGQTLGEIWTPPMQQQARLGDKNQEHCTVYNMMRLADFLFQVTGESAYLDYYEQNLYNGILAQGHWRGARPNGPKGAFPMTGLLTYFLPLMPGARKAWASETDDFFCCHGSLVQANASHHEGMLYVNDDTITLAQYFSLDATCRLASGTVSLTVETESFSGGGFWNKAHPEPEGDPLTARVSSTPGCVAFYVALRPETETTPINLKIRIPWWIQGEPVVRLNGASVEVPGDDGFLVLSRTWTSSDELYVEFPKGLHTWPLADNPDTVAFLDGPVVLAGLVERERVLYGDPDKPETLLRRDSERQWVEWTGNYHTRDLDDGFRFIPLYRVGYEPYSVYFPVKSASI